MAFVLALVVNEVPLVRTVVPRNLPLPPVPALDHFTPAVWVLSAVSTWPSVPTPTRTGVDAPLAAIRSPFVVTMLLSIRFVSIDVQLSVTG